MRKSVFLLFPVLLFCSGCFNQGDFGAKFCAVYRNYDSAAFHLQKYIEKEERVSAPYWLFLGVAEMYRGNIPEMFAAFEKAEQSGELFPELLLTRCNWYIESGNFEKAKADYENLEKMLEKSIETVINYYKNLVDTENSEQEAVIETYLLMLTDTDFLNQIKKEYNSSEFNVEHIVQKKIDETTSQLRAVGDEYLSERAQDIEEVFEKVLFNMLGYSSVGVESVIPDSIVVAENIMPSEAMLLFRKRIKALVLQEGGVSSHISILARTYGIPSVFGVENPTSSIETGNTIVVDATKSLVIVEPDKSIRTDYQIKQENAEKRIKELAQFISQKAQTKDNVPITIYANIGTNAISAKIASQKVIVLPKLNGSGKFSVASLKAVHFATP